MRQRLRYADELLGPADHILSGSDQTDAIYEQMATMIDHPLHVIVKFGSGIPSAVQGKALLDFEKSLRALSGVRVEVFKETKGDDSKLRSAMTPEQRAKL